jgi:hypothetical protein
MGSSNMGIYLDSFVLVFYILVVQSFVLCFDGKCVVQTLENMKVYLNYPITFIVCYMQ